MRVWLWLLVSVALAAAPAWSAEPDTLLQRVKESSTLRACAAAYVPWNLKNPITNEWEGIDSDITQAIGKALGVKIEYVDVTWATVITSLQTGKCDIAVAALWTSPARAEQVSFTRPIGGDGMTLFVPSDSPVQSYADIDKAGKVIVVRSGSGEERTAKEVFKNAEVKSISSDQAGAQILEVAAGRADATFAALSGNAMFVHQNDNIHVRPLPELMMNVTPYAFAVPAREYFFRDYVNVVLGNLDTSGELQRIKQKYIGSVH